VGNEKTHDEYGSMPSAKGNKDVAINLCFVNTTKTWGGGERWHFENAEYAHHRGFNVRVVCSKKSSLHEKAIKAGIPCFPVDISNVSFLNPQKVHKLKRYFTSNRLDVVIFNGPADLKTAGIAAFCAKVPVRIYRRGLATAPHAGLFNHFLFTKVVTDFIVNSKATASQLFSKSEKSKQKASVHVLYNGVEPHPKDIKHTPGQGKMVFGNASRLVPQKGLHYLLEMASVLKETRTDFTVRIAGTGPREQALKNIAAELNLNDVVEFSGFVDDVQAFMSGIDVYVCTSVFEGFGFSIAEAMHAGKPVIGFDVSSNPELIADGKTGFLIPPFDVKTLAEKAVILMKNRELRQKLGDEGQRVAMEKFNKNLQRERLCELIKGLIDREM